MYLPCGVTGTTRFLMILSTLPNEKKFSGQALCYTPRNFCQTLCYTHRAQCGTGQPLKVSLEYTTASSLCSRCFRMCYYARCRSDNLNQPEFSIIYATLKRCGRMEPLIIQINDPRQSVDRLHRTLLLLHPAGTSR